MSSFYGSGDVAVWKRVGLVGHSATVSAQQQKVAAEKRIDLGKREAALAATRDYRT